VHLSGVPSHAPDPALLADLLRAAGPDAGLTLKGLADLHAGRTAALVRPLGSVHETIALGESGLVWLVMRNAEEAVVKKDTLAQWFGEERLPLAWWNERRPARPVGLLQVRKTIGEVQELMKREM
jgi:hypothetical protein